MENFSYEAEARRSCFCQPRTSEWTDGIAKMAENFVAAAVSISEIQHGKYFSRIDGERVVQWEFEVERLPKTGYRVPNPVKINGAEIIFGILFSEDMVNDKPDREVMGLLKAIGERIATLPQTMTLPARKKVGRMAATKRDTKSKHRPKIWAKSQGNTVQNYLKDYRYRPSFGGIRL